MNWATRIAAAVSAAALTAAGASLRADEIEAGPLFHNFRLTLAAGDRHEALGPLAWWQETAEEDSWGVPPFAAGVSSTALDYERFESLYPALTYTRYGPERRFQFFQLFSFGGRQTLDGETRSQGSVWPLVFWQRSDNPASNYWAVLPFYGRVENHLFRDEMRVEASLFYVWWRIGEVETRSTLFPLIHWRKGGGVKGWQVMPFAGHETKMARVSTNLAGDPEPVPGYNEWFFLWPFLGVEDRGLGTTNVEHLRYSLPFYSFLRSPARDNTTLLWPFFTRTEDRVQGFVEWGAPYPFVGWARGAGKHGNRAWPLWGRVEGQGAESDFVLWPFYTHRRAEHPAFRRERWTSAFFLFNHQFLENRANGAVQRRFELWPFFAWRRDFDGRERLQALALAETVFPDNPSIRRSWSPLWSLYRRERNPAARASSDSLLWNLWRRDRTGEETRSSFVFGLLRSLDDGSGRHWRFFWSRLPKSAAAIPPPAPPTAAPPTRN